MPAINSKDDIETKRNPQTPPPGSGRPSSGSDDSGTGSSGSSPLIGNEGEETKEDLDSAWNGPNLTSPIIEETIDLQACPPFNSRGVQLAPGESVVIADTDGQIVRFLQELTKGGLALFTQDSWAQMLDVINFEDFKSGTANARMKAFSDRCSSYRDMRDHEKPWDTAEFRQDQLNLTEKLPRYKALLNQAFAAATTQRHQIDIPTREIIFIGDTTCDADASAGDMYRYMSAVIAEEHGVKITEMASNHGFFSIGLQQFLNKLVEPDNTPKRNKKVPITLSPDLKTALSTIMSRSFPQRLRELIDMRSLQSCYQTFSAETAEKLGRMTEAVGFIKKYSTYQKAEETTAIPGGPLPHQEPQAERLKDLKNELASLLRILHEKKPTLFEKVLKQCPEISPSSIQHLNKLLDAASLRYCFDFFSSLGSNRVQVLEVFDFIRNYDAYAKETAPDSGESRNLQYKISQAQKIKDLKNELASLLMALHKRQPALFKAVLIQLTETSPSFLQHLDELIDIKYLQYCFAFFSEKIGIHMGVFNFIEDYKAHTAITEIALVPGNFTQHMAAQTQRFSDLKDDLASLLPMLRDKEPKLFKSALKRLPELKPAFLPTHAIDRDRLVQQFKTQDHAFNAERLLEIFNFLQSVSPRLLEEIKQTQRAIGKFPGALKEADTQAEKKILRKKKTNDDNALKEQLATLAELLSFFPARSSILLKIMTRHAEDLGQHYPQIYKLAQEELGEDISSMVDGGQGLSADDLRAAHKSMDKSRTHACFPANNKKLMAELLALPNKQGIFQDLINMVDALTTVCEMVLKQRTALPSDLDAYRGSSYSEFLYLLPCHTLDDANLDFETVRTQVEIAQEAGSKSTEKEYYTRYDTIAATITVSGERPLTYTNYTIDKETGEKTPINDTGSFKDGVSEKYQETVTSLYTGLIGKDAKPVEGLKSRCAELKTMTDAWNSTQCLIRRSGLKGDYIVHAPGVGLKGETSDESMVFHTLIPLAKIMLAALKENKKGIHRSEATALFSKLSKSAKAIPNNLTDDAATHKKILSFIDDINEGYRFFVRHDLLVTTMTTAIPDTHIGLLSRSPDAEDWESILKRAGRYTGSLPMDLGLLAKHNPLYNFVYPLNALIWSRCDSASDEQMVYTDYKTKEQLCHLQHNSGIIYGHTGGSGPNRKGIDTRKDKKKKVNQPTRTARMQEKPDATMLAQIPKETGFFLPQFFKQLIEEANNEDIDRRGTKTAAELDNVRINGGWDVEYKGLRRLLKDCSEKITARVEGDTRISVTEALADLLSYVRDHLCASDELKAQAKVAKCYLPAEEQALLRAEHAYCVKKDFETDRNNGGKPRNRQLAEFMIPLYTFDLNTSALFPREFGQRYVYYRLYRDDIANALGASEFYNSQARALAEAEIKKPSTIKPEATKPTCMDYFRETVGAVALIPATCAAFAQFMLGIGDFLSDEDYLTLGEFLGNRITLSVSASFLWAAYVLVKLKDQLLAPTETANGPKEPSPALVKFLNGLQRIFPQFSGVSRQLLFSFFIRPFLYIELISICTKIVTFLSGGFACPPVDTGNTTNTTVTTITPDPSTTPTLAPGTYSGDPLYADYYPYFGTATIWAVAVSTCGMVLSLKDPTTKMFPGHEAPSNIIDAFERSTSKHMRRTQWMWEGYNRWFDGSLFLGVGVYELLVNFGLTCTNTIAAFYASCTMVVYLALSAALYPPQWVSICSSKIKPNNCQKRAIEEEPSILEIGKLLVEKKDTQVDKNKIARALSQHLITASILPVYFYFLYIFYIYLVYTNISTDEYIPADLSNPFSQGLWGFTLSSLSLLCLDSALASGRDFGTTSAVHGANKARKYAEKGVTFLHKNRDREASALAESGEAPGWGTSLFPPKRRSFAITNRTKALSVHRQIKDRTDTAPSHQPRTSSTHG